MMKNGLKRILLPGLAGYLALLALLTLAESGNPDSSIHSFVDALWYSVVTLSTVGYGDMYPTTPLGRIIGVCFVLMSLGVLSFIVGTIISFVNERMLPALQLSLVRGRPWYVFDDANEVSLALAADLEKKDPNGVFLFPLSQADRVGRERNIRFYPDTMEQAVQGKSDSCSLFFLNPDRSNYTPALDALSLGHPVYCRSQQVPADCPEQLILFNRYSCCAREYWRTHAAGSREQSIVLLGSGQYAQHLLEQGLLVNVFGPAHSVSYHVFGDWSEFRRNHLQLEATLSVGKADPDRDCLFFHSEAWNDASDLILQADRIILCSDDETENLNLLRTLRKYFPTNAALHLRSVGSIPGETVFGTNEAIYTADLVMGTQLTEIARIMHGIYAAGSDNAPAWEALSDFLQQSNIAAADHLLTKARILLGDDSITALTKEVCTAAFNEYRRTHSARAEEYREIEHLRWMRFHSLYNWQHAPVRDNTARKHPLMVPYDCLSAAEQAKDDFAWELLGKIAECMK